jgi:phage/plasmid-associated DNA primase
VYAGILPLWSKVLLGSYNTPPHSSLSTLADGFAEFKLLMEQLHEWQVDDNPVLQFAEEKVTFAAGGRTSPARLYEAYYQWAFSNGYKEKENLFGGRNGFIKAFTRMFAYKLEDGGKAHRSNGKRFIGGITLKNE